MILGRSGYVAAAIGALLIAVFLLSRPLPAAAEHAAVQRCYPPIRLGFSLIPACNGPGAQQRSWVSPSAARGGIIYVSEWGANEVELFSASPGYQQLGVLTGFTSPQGITVDRKGNLYVANTNGSDVLIYARGATSPSRTLMDPGEGPADVAVAPDGTVYVANETNASGSGGSISIYPPGATTPSRTLTNSQFYFVIGVCLDRSLNLYVSFNSSASGGGEVFQLSRSGRQWSASDTGIRVTWGGMPAVDDAGYVVEPDQGSPYVSGAVNVYAPGPVKLYAFAGPGQPLAVALREGERRAYVSRPDLGVAQVWTYPGPTVRLLASLPAIGGGGTSTIAVDPSDDE